MTHPTALITGSSKGFGRSLALAFARNGGAVILHGRDEARLANVREQVLQIGAECDVVHGDLRREATIDALYEAARRHDLDVLINNAGIYANRPFSTVSIEVFREVIETNLLAPVALTRKIFPLFQKKQSGLVVNINSVAGKNGSDGESAYCASKHGLRGFTRSIQFEANRDRIRVVDVYLGTMNTAMVEGRRDPAKCIQTDEAADLVVSLCRGYQSLRIDEIDLSRRNY